MDDKTKYGSLGESKIISWLIANDYWVYTGFSGKEPCDILFQLDKTIYKMQVKTATQRNDADTAWSVELKSTRSNTTTNTIKNFDKSCYDFLGIYFPFVDKIIIIPCVDIHTVSQYLVYDTKLLGWSGIGVPNTLEKCERESV